MTVEFENAFFEVGRCCSAGLLDVPCYDIFWYIGNFCICYNLSQLPILLGVRA